VATAKFYRNVQSYEKLKHLADCQDGLINAYEIIGTVDLSKEGFTEFGNDFYTHSSFFIPYLQKSKIENDIFKCVLIKLEGVPTVLVLLNGYQYPRFVALYRI